MKEKFNYVIISILKQEDEDDAVLTSLGAGKDTNMEWQDVMIPSQDSDKRTYGQLKTVEMMLLPRPMTEEEYEDWHGNSFEEAPEELTSRINRIREIYEIDGDDE